MFFSRRVAGYPRDRFFQVKNWDRRPEESCLAGLDILAQDRNERALYPGGPFLFFARSWWGSFWIRFPEQGCPVDAGTAILKRVRNLLNSIHDLGVLKPQDVMSPAAFAIHHALGMRRQEGRGETHA
jgi:hypothetical protein